MRTYRFLGTEFSTLEAASKAVNGLSSNKDHAITALSFVRKHYDKAESKAQENLATVVHSIASLHPNFSEKTLQAINYIYSRSEKTKNTQETLNSALLTLARREEVARKALSVAKRHFSEATIRSQIGLARVLLHLAEVEAHGKAATAFIKEHFMRTRGSSDLRGSFVEAIDRLSKHQGHMKSALALISDLLVETGGKARKTLLSTLQGLSLRPEHGKKVASIVSDHADAFTGRDRRGLEECLRSAYTAARMGIGTGTERKIRQVALEKGIHLGRTRRHGHL